MDGVNVGDVAIVERGTTIVSGRVTENGPRYIVIEHLIGSLSTEHGWRVSAVITQKELDGDVEPPPMEQAS